MTFKIHKYLNSICLKCIFVSLAAIIAGCGASINRAKVMDRFRVIHGCEPETTSAVGSGGYVVRGCGIESHFSCFDTGDNDSEDHGLVGAMFDLATSHTYDACIHDFSRGAYRSPRREIPTLTLDTTDDGLEKIEASFILNEGLLVIAGIPTQFGDQVGCIYKPLSDIALPEQCSVRFWADGTSISPAKVIHSKTETKAAIQFILRPGDLARMFKSDRVVGSVCELPVRFSANQRELLREFVIQFEQKAIVAGLAAPPA